MKTLAKPQAAVQTAPIEVTERDKRHLEEVIQETKNRGSCEANLDSLMSALKGATVVSSEAVSPKVVTMGSLVSIIDRSTRERLQYRLVYPSDSAYHKNAISVMSSIGSGMLGLKVGDQFSRAVPDGIRTFEIAKVEYQPDAANTCNYSGPLREGVAQCCGCAE